MKRADLDAVEDLARRLIERASREGVHPNEVGDLMCDTLAQMVDELRAQRKLEAALRERHENLQHGGDARLHKPMLCGDARYFEKGCTICEALAALEAM